MEGSVGGCLTGLSETKTKPSSQLNLELTLGLSFANGKLNLVQDGKLGRKLIDLF